MVSDRLAKALVVMLVLAIPAGCASLGDGRSRNAITASEGFYVAPAGHGVPSDIREILSAGGLNTSDPSAPTARTQVAELASGTGRPNAAVALAARRAKDAVLTPVLALSPQTTSAQLPQIAAAVIPSAVGDPDGRAIRLPDIEVADPPSPVPSAKESRDSKRERPRTRMQVSAVQQATPSADLPRRF